jgi:PAS domain S-box-containing protein
MDIRGPLLIEFFLIFLLLIIIFKQYYFLESAKFILLPTRNYQYNKIKHNQPLPIFSSQVIISGKVNELENPSVLDSFFFNSPIGLLKTDLQGFILVSNQSVIKILGFNNKEELLAINYINNLFRDKTNKSNLVELINSGSNFTFEENWHKRPGATIYLKENFRVVKDEKGNPVHIEIAVEDITEKKKALRAQQITEEKFKTIIDQVPIGIYRTLATGEILFSNKYLANLLGYDSSDEIKGKAAREFLLNPTENRDNIKKQIFLQNPTFSHEYIIVKKDGSEIWVQDTSNIIFDTSNEVLFFDGTIEEITSRKNAEQELNRLITAINQISEGIIITDTDFIIQYVNPAFEKMTNYKPNEIKGKSLKILDSVQQPKEFYLKMYSTLFADKIWSQVVNDKKKNGESIEVQTTITPIKDSEGNIVNFVAIKRDITEERKLEQHLRNSQKLQAIGTLAGGIAHDFNNILMGMQIYTEILLKKISENSPEHDLLKKVYSAQNRARDLIRQILTFSRQSGDEREPLQIHIIVKEALKLIKSTFPSTLRLEQKIHDCGSISGNPTQIHQIVMNLCTNAHHAMEGHGKLSIGLDKIEYIEYPDGKMKKTGNSWVRLKVSDTGEGIEKKIQERIFEPFFTTKVVGQGTGLGLATVHGIVKQYGGEIFFETELGKGTIFNIYLPAL